MRVKKPGTRYCENEVPSLRVRELRELGLLEPGAAKRVTWSDGVSVTVRARQHVVMLGDVIVSYVMQPRGRSGMARLFQCPSCPRAAFRLFLVEGTWGCYVCRRILHATEVLPQPDRRRYRVQRMLERIATKPACLTRYTRKVLPKALARFQEVA